MTWWTPDVMRVACGGSWVVRPPQIALPPDRPADLPLPPLHAPISGVSTDTRTLKPGQAFVALRGENFDGHRFVEQAVMGGAPIVIVDDASCVPEGGFTPAVGVMKVSDTGQALLKLAASYRKSLTRTKVIAVCGSNGKTTTTRLIDHVLGRFLRGSASKKSFNNAVGVPLTILAAKENDQYLVCEVGTNAPGEIAQLGVVVQPDIAVITSIGHEHLEKLNDIAGVAKEEAEIVRHVRPKGCVIATGDAPALTDHLRTTAMVITFGRSKDANLRLTAARHERADMPGSSASAACLVFSINGRQEVRLPLVGEHNALNAMAALAVARRMGIDETKAGKALESAGGAEMRLAITDVQGVTIINDAYNANPDSMLAAVDTAIALRQHVLSQCTRLVLVLGEMLELGAASDTSHRMIGQAIAKRAGSGIDQVVLVGTGMKAAHAELAMAGFPASSVLWTPDAGETHQRQIARAIRAGDLVLLKASRGVQLERVLGAIGKGEAGEVGGAGGTKDPCGDSIGEPARAPLLSAVGAGALTP